MGFPWGVRKQDDWRVSPWFWTEQLEGLSCHWIGKDWTEQVLNREAQELEFGYFETTDLLGNEVSLNRQYRVVWSSDEKYCLKVRIWELTAMRSYEFPKAADIGCTPPLTLDGHQPLEDTKMKETD